MFSVRPTRTVASALAALFLAAQLPAGAMAQVYYAPLDGLTRAGFVQLLLQEKGIQAFSGGYCFKDVTNQAFAPFVCTAKQYQIVSGDPSGKFRPNDRILFVEAAAMVVRAEGVRVPYDPIWYVPYIEQLGEWDAYPHSVPNIFGNVTSSQALEMIREAANGEEDDDDDDDDDNDDGSDDINLRITSSDDTPEAGDRVTLRIRLENESNDDIENIDVSAELDNEMEYISSSDSGDEDDGDVDWENIDVDEDETKTLVLTVELDDSLDDGDTVRISVEADGESASKTLRINDDDDDDEDEGLERLSITDSPNPVEPGDEILYKIKLENNEDERTTVDVEAELDEDVTYVSSSDIGSRSGDTVRWNDLRLDPGEELTLSLRVRVDESADDGDEIRLDVEANDEEDSETTLVEDDDEDDDDDTDVNVTVTDSPEPISRGDELEYRITIDNQENHDITIDVRALLDEETSFLFASSNPDLEGDDEVVWEDIEIDRDESRTLVLTVRVSQNADRSGSLRLQVEAGNDEETESTEVN